MRMELSASLSLISKLKAAGLEPDDDALDTLSERLGFGIRRAAVPQPGMMPFSAQSIPLSAADSVADHEAASSADDLRRAAADDLAPLKDVVAASISPDDCIRRVQEWVSSHNLANAADVIEKALYVYSMAGARAARPARRK